MRATERIQWTSIVALALVLVGDTLAAQTRPARVSLKSLAELSQHVGDYPCRNGILKSPVLHRALRGVLGSDYREYLEHMGESGCGAIEKRGSFVVMDVSQMHVGGYSSLIFVKPSTGDTYLFWLQDTVRAGLFKVYGKRPIPLEVSTGIVDDMNHGWGHVARFSWVNGTLLIDEPLSRHPGTLTFHRPAAWAVRAPADSIYVAEFVVPRAAGDPEDGKMTVYYHGGGGNVAADLERSVADFRSIREPIRTTTTVNGLRLTSVDVSGTYISQVIPGSKQRHNKPGFRMRATYVETPKGFYSIELIGPASTIAKASAAFEEFLGSLAFK